MTNSYSSIALALGLVLATGCASRSSEASRVYPPPGPVFAGAAPPGVIPTGTQLVIRTQDLIDTEDAVPGRTYSAEVATSVIDSGGNLIVPEGSCAELIVVKTSTGGVLGTPRLSLAVRSITVDGTTYPVVSGIIKQSARRKGLGANRRTAQWVGGSAVAGTIIGAIAGGGVGAAIGAAVGAAGGATVQVVTKGKHVRVPPETLLTFQTDRPICLEGYPAAGSLPIT